jgi:hypothetical protein
MVLGDSQARGRGEREVTMLQQDLADRLEKARDAALLKSTKTIEKWKEDRRDFLHLCLENSPAILAALRALTDAREDAHEFPNEADNLLRVVLAYGAVHAFNHMERAARGLHRLAVASAPTITPTRDREGK